MAVKLRFKRLGRKGRPFYRLQSVDSRTRRNGRAIEELGFYDPLAPDPAKRVVFNSERVAYWLSIGAQPSETVRGLLQSLGIRKPPAAKSAG